MRSLLGVRPGLSKMHLVQDVPELVVCIFIVVSKDTPVGTYRPWLTPFLGIVHKVLCVCVCICDKKRVYRSTTLCGWLAGRLVNRGTSLFSF